MKNPHKILFLFAFSFLFQGNVLAQETKTIGPSGDFQTFTDAINDLNQITSIEQNYIFEVSAGTYPEQISLTNLNNPSFFTITFKKADGETGEVIINPDNYDFGNYVVQVNGDYYNFENISFINSSTTSNIGRVIDLATINFIENINFTNCTFIGRSDLTIDQYSNDEYSIVNSSNDKYTNNISFLNGTIIGGSYSFYINNSTISSSRITISNCDITDFYSTGIYFTEINEFTITNNKITDKIDISETPATGIYTLSPNWNGFEISANKIDLQRDNTKTCIHLETVTETINQGADYLVKNNMLTTKGASAVNNSTGIKLTNSKFVNILFNSIHVQDGSIESSPIYFSASSSPLSLNNNLLINTGLGYALWIAMPDQQLLSNYNDYFASSGLIIREYYTSYNLLDWQNHSGLDFNSFSAMPNFVSTSDLHISGSLSYVEGRAFDNFANTIDIDGEPRNNIFPDVGADEGMFTLLWTGNINAPVTWHGTVFIETDIAIIDGGGSQTKSGALTILPATILKFMNGSKILAQGEINAIGLKNAEILFTAEGSDVSETWGGIQHENVVMGKGMAIYQYCKFENSLAENGGVFNIIENNNVTIQNCKFQNNNANLGGAIYTINCASTIDANLFYNNTADEGGAIYTANGTAQITNNIFNQNTANIQGGAIRINESFGRITNNTFFENNSPNDGTEVYLGFTSTPGFSINNSIFWNTTTTNKLVFDTYGGTQISNCIATGGIVGGTTIYDEDPLFKDPSNLNFSVQANSIAVDAGFDNEELPLYDYAGNNRIHSQSNTVDIGAFELQGQRLVANAGEDFEFCSNEQYLPSTYNIWPYNFEWTILDNTDAFIEEKSQSMFIISNIPPNTTLDVVLSVTNGFIIETDTVGITNLQPYVNAGDDILLINEDINNDIFPDMAFNASGTPTLGWGEWMMTSSTAVPPPTIENLGLNISPVTGINYGISTFAWTVYDENECSNSDTILIVAGHSYTSVEGNTAFDWNNSEHWQNAGGTTPGEADSVTIYGVTGNVGFSGAICDRLNIGNGSSLTILGTTKGPSDLSCRTLTVGEGPAAKYNEIKGSANLYVENNATLNIGAEYISKSRSVYGSGLFIGSGGTVFIRPNAEKNIKGDAGLNIGSGGFVFIRPNAEKDSKGVAEMRIGSGGFVFIRPNAEKDKTKKGNGGDIEIGEDGALILEQTIAKSVGGYLELGGGRSIFIRPNAEKGTGGHLGIYGGTVFIRPNAEKTKGPTNSSIYCGAGGTIFIRPNAEKELSESNLISPSLFIDGGKVIVGNSAKAKTVTGSLQFNQIFIRPNAEKGLASDTSLIIYPSGELVLSDTFNVNMPKILIKKGTAVSFMEGSNIDFNGLGFIKIEESASLIDMNPIPNFEIETEHTFIGEVEYLFSPSISNMDGYYLGEGKSLGTWEEATASWLPFNDAGLLYGGTGYILKYDWADTYKTFYGTANTGNFNIPVTSTDIGNFEFEGWNLLGNPYPSAIDFEKIVLNDKINNNFYIFNPIEKNFKIYQQGGISLNGAEQYAIPNEAFFVKTDADATFNIDNNARVHFSANTNATKEVDNILKLKVTGTTYSDETAILFNQYAYDTYDKEYDAAKLILQPVQTPVLYSKIAGNDAPIAINTFKYLALTTRTIPLFFEAKTDGSFTINASELIFNDAVTVFLKDLNDDSVHDLKANPSYSFDYTNGDVANRFEVIFSGFVGMEDIVSESNINVFSNNNTIFINSNSEKTTVKIYNLKGQLLLQKDLSNSGISTINVNFPQSIYLVKVITNEEIVTTKVSISR